MSAARRAVLAIAIVVIVIAASVGAYLVLTQSSKGRVSIYVKDLPDDWAHVNVTFSVVRIHEADAGNDSGWHALDIKNGTVDLVSLTNVSELLATGKVAEGRYTQIRIVVSAATGMMTNGTSVTFSVPSGELKTTHPFNVTSGHTETLTLDFDLDRCIVHNASGWIFTPVVGSISES